MRRIAVQYSDANGELAWNTFKGPNVSLQVGGDGTLTISDWEGEQGLGRTIFAPGRWILVDACQMVPSAEGAADA